MTAQKFWRDRPTNMPSFKKLLFSILTTPHTLQHYTPNSMRFFLFVFLFVFIATTGHAQEEAADSLGTIYTDTKPTLQVDAKGMKEQGIDVKKKKKGKKAKSEKRMKGNRFMGSEVKKVYKKAEVRRRMVTETYYILKEFAPPPRYSDSRKVYNLEKQTTEQVQEIDRKNTALLHGPYVKKEDRRVVVRGEYYRGVPHGRWERLTRDGFVISKEYYDKGIPVGSKVEYYENKKLKAVTPMREGRPDGFYIAFYPSGRVKERGYYKFGEKIGLWTTYFDRSLRSGNSARHRETLYPKKPFTAESPVVKREWDEKGKLTKK